jgi:tetratricopeptide (TPR) repeat protein
VKVDFPLWQRWNDYGIGLLLEGQGGAKGELRQAAEAFVEVEKLDRFDGPLNLARVYFAEGRLDEAVAALERARVAKEPVAPHWTLSWLTGLVNRQQGNLETAENNLRSVLETVTPEMRERGFDFSVDYEVINELGQVQFDRAKQLRGDRNRAERERLLKDAIAQFEKTLSIDSENVTAHYNLQLLYTQLGDEAKAKRHEELHARYKPDDNARDRAVALARQKYPAADHAAEALVIYDLQRKEAPEASESAAVPSESAAVASDSASESPSELVSEE